MRITEVRLRRVSGTMRVDGPLFEERLSRPVDVYPEFLEGSAPLQIVGRERGYQIDGSKYREIAIFVEIATDDGASGIAGPVMTEAVAFHITKLRQLVIGRDPMATEFLWDVMYRSSSHGRRSEPMLAISLIDNALWDLKGKALGVPVHRLIGGPTQQRIPAYASMLGFATLDLGLVRERALRIKEEGYRAQKWFFRYAAMQGPEGLRRNVELAETVRGAVGEEVEIMFDCWQSMNPTSAIALINAIADVRPRWLEEVLMPDSIESSRRLRDMSVIPIAGGEHLYGRWDFGRFMAAGAVDVIQPDVNWSGGLSEVLKIGAIASALDVQVVAHHGSSPQGMAWSAAQSPAATPYVEVLVKHTAKDYFFSVDGGPSLVDGHVEVSESAGFGFDLDETMIDEEIEMWRDG